MLFDVKIQDNLQNINNNSQISKQNISPKNNSVVDAVDKIKDLSNESKLNESQVNQKENHNSMKS